MTDNEKAATFIGYPPRLCEPECPTGKNCKWDAESQSWRCATCGARYYTPDMSDPRNYMKALEDLLNKGTIGEVSIGLESIEFDPPLDDYCTPGPYFFTGQASNALAVKALAALYDGEAAQR